MPSCRAHLAVQPGAARLQPHASEIGQAKSTDKKKDSKNIASTQLALRPADETIKQQSRVNALQLTATKENPPGLETSHPRHLTQSRSAGAQRWFGLAADGCSEPPCPAPIATPTRSAHPPQGWAGRQSRAVVSAPESLTNLGGPTARSSRRARATPVWRASAVPRAHTYSADPCQRAGVSV